MVLNTVHFFFFLYFGAETYVDLHYDLNGSNSLK